MNPFWSSLSKLVTTQQDSDLQFLKTVSVFADLSGREISKVSRLFHIRNFSDEERIFTKGQPGSAFYIIKTGGIRVVDTDAAEEIQLALLGAGDLIGELSILDETPRSATAIASGQTQLLAIFKGDFDTFMQQEPVIAAKIYRRIAIVIGLRLKATNALLKKRES